MPLDIGIGLLLGIALHSLSGLNYQLCLFIGVVSCLLPDIDFIWKLLTDKIRGKSLQTKFHRDGLHYPLLFIPIVIFIGLLFNPWVALILGVGCVTHFIHDSIGVGWGVKWLYPFSKKSYMFLYVAGVPTNKEMPRKLFYSFNDVEREKLIIEYGDPNWIKHIYLRPHIFGFIEYAVFAIGLFAAIKY